MGEISICVSTQLYEGTTITSIMPSYVRLLQRLHGNGWSINPRKLRRILEDQNQIVVFVCEGREILATAQASLSLLLPRRPVYINNVITQEEHEGKGYGRRAMECLEYTAQKKWGEENWPLFFTLTNNPDKANAGFYESCGYIVRVSESQNATVVWVKESD